MAITSSSPPIEVQVAFQAWSLNSVSICLKKHELSSNVVKLAEFHGKDEAKPERKKTQLQRWSPPEQGVYKANYDGAYFVEEEKAGIDVVVRNHLDRLYLKEIRRLLSKL